MPDIADTSATDDAGAAAVEAAVEESSGPATQRNNKLPAETDTPYSVEDGDEEMGSGALKSAASAFTSLLLVGMLFSLLSSFCSDTVIIQVPSSLWLDRVRIVLACWAS